VVETTEVITALMKAEIVLNPPLPQSPRPQDTLGSPNTQLPSERARPNPSPPFLGAILPPSEAWCHKPTPKQHYP